jgi:hypothetical protein
MSQQDFGWLKQQGDRPEPRMGFVTMFWRMRGTTEGTSSAACITPKSAWAAHSVHANCGRRLAIVQGVDADDQIAQAADQWRLNLIAKGFEEIA